jgi:hypothetical protein
MYKGVKGSIKCENQPQIKVRRVNYQLINFENLEGPEDEGRVLEVSFSFLLYLFQHINSIPR